MRKVAKVVCSTDVVKVMLCEMPEGVYLFEYDEIEDAPAISDCLFADMVQAMEVASEEFGVEADEWYEIEDALDTCLRDRIAPVRPLGYGTSHVDWCRYEMLVEGRWLAIAYD